MLKEVGASGQISLGKKYAGKLFDVILHPGDRFELIPVHIVATAPPQAPAIVQVADGWGPPGGYDGCTQWALDNRVALEQYARQIGEEGTAAEQLQRFLAEHPEMVAGDHGEVGSVRQSEPGRPAFKELGGTHRDRAGQVTAGWQVGDSWATVGRGPGLLSTRRIVWQCYHLTQAAVIMLAAIHTFKFRLCKFSSAMTCGDVFNFPFIFKSLYGFRDLHIRLIHQMQAAQYGSMPFSVELAGRSDIV